MISHGTILETDHEVFGATPVYDGATPAKETDLFLSYAFAGWDKEIVPVTGDVTYTAIYTGTRLSYGFTGHSLTLEGDVGITTMLVYGARAQINFNHNTANLANQGLSYTLQEVTVDMVPSTASDMTESLDAYGLAYAGTTLVYLAKTSMRHYYTIVDLDKFLAVKDSITFNGEKASYQMKDGKLCFELQNIAASDLGTVYTLRIDTNEYRCSALDYVRNCLSASYAPYNTKQLVMATYWYNQAANAYFGR